MTSILLTAVLAAALAAPAPAPKNLTVTWPVGRHHLTLTSAAQFAGAVSSLKVDGFEYLDANDHGRLLQGAISFDSQGECRNPTQGGSTKDKNQGSSQLLGAEVTPVKWRTRTRMAFWYDNGARCPLPSGQSAKAPAGTLSNVVYSQAITPHPGQAVVLDDKIEFDTTQPHQAAAVEAVTAYLPQVFQVFDGLPAAGKAPMPLANPTFTGRDQVVIATTRDRSHAMAIVPAARGGAAKFGSGEIDGVPKLNVAYSETKGYPAGPHRYRCEIVLGSEAEVIAALHARGW